MPIARCRDCSAKVEYNEDDDWRDLRCPICDSPLRNRSRPDERNDARADGEETSRRREKRSSDDEDRRGRSNRDDDDRPRRSKDEYDERPRRSRDEVRSDRRYRDDDDRPRRRSSGASQSSIGKQVAWIGPVVAIVVACVLGFVRYSVKGGLFGSGGDAIPEREWKMLEEPNRFKVLMPGDPARKVEAGAVQAITRELIYSRNIEFAVSHTEPPFPPEQRGVPAEPVLNEACDGAKTQLSTKMKVVELRREAIELGGFPGKRIILDIPEKKGQAIFCVYFTGAHLYAVGVAGRGYGQDHEVVKRFFNSFEILEKRPSTNPPKVALTPPDNPVKQGDPVSVPVKPANPRPVRPLPNSPEGVKKGSGIQGAFGAEFKDGAPAGGLLVGFEFGLGRSGNRNVLKAVRPIYRVGDKESAGSKWGADFSTPVKVVARTGYAVGAITVKSALLVEGLSITFMKVGEGGLDPNDSYQSDWIGGMGGHPPVMVGGDGMLVTGIKGRMKDKELSGIGLLQGEKLGPGDRPGIRPTEVRGAAFDPEFRDASENNDLLVGLEIGLGKFVQNDVIHGIRPVYQSGDKQTFGKQWGKNVNKTVTAIAKPGYAIGAVTLKTGLGVDGMSVTFMKVVNGKLDPSDAYESEWIGGMGGGPPGKVKVDGAACVGIVVKINRGGDVSGLGLLQASESNDK